MTAASVCLQCRRGHHDACKDPDTCACTECGHGILEWEEPAAGRGRHGSTPVSDEQLALLREHPKRWARVRDYSRASSAGSTAGRIRTGKVPALDPDDWEVAGRRTPTGSALYLRFVGEP